MWLLCIILGFFCLNLNPVLIVQGAAQAPRGALGNLSEGGRPKMCKEMLFPLCAAGGSEAHSRISALPTVLLASASLLFQPGGPEAFPCPSHIRD